MGRIDATLPLTITTMEQNLGRYIERPRFESVLFGLFADGLWSGMFYSGLAGVGYTCLRQADRSLPNVLIWE